MSEPTADARRTTRHGLALLGWLVVFGLLLTAAVDRMGLKYVQGVIWPTDMHTFGLHDGPRSIDVAILGSSRASFDLTPSVIDACLADKLSRPTHTVNLARVFATGHTMRPRDSCYVAWCALDLRGRGPLRAETRPETRRTAGLGVTSEEGPR